MLGLMLIVIFITSIDGDEYYYPLMLPMPSRSTEPQALHHPLRLGGPQRLRLRGRLGGRGGQAGRRGLLELPRRDNAMGRKRGKNAEETGEIRKKYGKNKGK